MSELSDYFAQFGINLNTERYSGSNGLALAQQDALNAASANQASTYGGLPELTATGPITQSANGSYWIVPTASGVRYVAPDTTGTMQANNPASFVLNRGGNQYFSRSGDGSYVAEGANPNSMRFNGTLPGMTPMQGDLSQYKVWDQAPTEKYYADPKDESVFQQFMQGPAIPLGGFLGAGAIGSGGLGNFLGSFGQGASAAGGGLSGGGMFNPFADFGADYFSGAGNFTGSLPYSDPIEGLIDLTNKGMTGEQAVQTLGQMNPSWTQSGLQFLANNPSQLFSSLGNVSKLLSGTSGESGTDLSKLLGGLASAGLGMYGANQQSKALTDIANQARSDRQPYLNASLNYLGNPDAYFAGPGKAAMDATLKGLSTKVGNPIGSPTAMGIATEAGLQDWRNAVTGFGNMGLAGQDLRANLQSSAAQANANGLNALGYGLNSVLNPQPNITDIVKAMNMGGLA